MKKLIALMLAMVMALSLVACGKPAENDNSANDNNTIPTAMPLPHGPS